MMSLTVPVQAIVEKDRQYYCIVRDADRWQPHAVQLASTNDKFVVVSDGVRSGDEIALNPKELADDLAFPAATPRDTAPAVAMAQPPDATPPRRHRPRRPASLTSIPSSARSFNDSTPIKTARFRRPRSPASRPADSPAEIPTGTA